jgi:RecA-family ATPase
MSAEPLDDGDLPEISSQASDDIASWRRILDRTKGDKRLNFERATVELLRLAETEESPARQAIIDAVYELAATAALDDDQTQAIMAHAQEEQADARINGFGTEPLLLRNDPAPAPIQWLDMSTWDDEPRPEREWAIRDRVPLNQAGLFSGEGGVGKSIIEMMKDVAHVAGKDWLGSMPAIGPAIYLGAEDDEKEIHIRFYDIAKHYGVTFKELIDGGLHVLCKLGQDATLCALTRSGRVETTGLYRQLYEAAGDIKPKNISIDTLSRAFAGSEIDRVQVYAFAMHMQALAMVASGSVTVLSHPSLQGIASGTGLSGSTAWQGAFRFRQYLKSTPTNDGEPPDTDLRQIEFKKNQYGPSGDTIVLRYQRGLFLPVAAMGSLDKLAAEQAADNLFLELLDKFQSQGRNISHHKNANSYAPAMFVKDPKAKSSGMYKALADAMERLFAAKKIKVEDYGRRSHPHTRIVRCRDERED